MTAKVIKVLVFEDGDPIGLLTRDEFLAKYGGAVVDTTPIVVKPPVDTKPVLAVGEGLPPASAVVGEGFVLTIPANAFIAATSVDVSDLPAGLSYRSDTRTISGTPTQAGSRTITVSATDGTSIVKSQFELTISAKTGNTPTPTLPPVVVKPPVVVPDVPITNTDDQSDETPDKTFEKA